MAASTVKHFVKTQNTLTQPESCIQAIGNFIDLGDGKGSNAGAYTADDFIDVLKVPAGAIITGGGIVALEKEGAALTVDLNTLGAEVDQDDIITTAFDLNAAAAVAAPFVKSGARFIADGTIQLELNHTADVARLYVWVTYIYEFNPLARLALVG